jgi:hypothetical protein
MKRWVFAVLLLAVVAVRFAQPIEDGDIFWHMAYGQQMLDHGTLIPDHALYSWMPASNATIYCTWLADFFFLGVWKAFGLTGLFASRYAAVLVVVGLLAFYARRCGLLARIETWLAMLVTVLASVVATYPKPEMLSLVLWNVLVFCFFQALLAMQEAKEASAPDDLISSIRRWIYAVPAVMLGWVNVHGGFVLAAPFLAITLLGAWVMLGNSPEGQKQAREISIAWVSCGAAAFATPYGWRYPQELLHFVLTGANSPDVAWNNAFQPTLSAAGYFFHLPEMLGWMAAGMLLAGLLFIGAWRKRGRHGAAPAVLCAVLFLAYVPLYLAYVRGTFLLPAIFGYSFLFLMKDIPAPTLFKRANLPRLTSIAAALFFVFLGARAVWQADTRPGVDTWMGFGIGYSQPVEEAGYLDRHHFGSRIYNTYNAGGYLLWSLYPHYKVMVDARSFPYLDWFNELYTFTRTDDPKAFREFMQRHPGDVALVDFQEDQVWRSFLNMTGWRPVFFGPSAAVFTKADAVSGPVEAAGSLSHLRNGPAGMKVFEFAEAVGDYHTAWNVLDQLEGSLRAQVDPGALVAAEEYRRAHAALRAGRYAESYDRFERALDHRLITNNDNTILFLLTAERKLELTGQMDKAPAIRAGLARLAASE